MPQQVKDAHFCGWVLKQGTQFPFNWHERLFAINAESHIVYYFEYKEASAGREAELVLRGEAELLDAYRLIPTPVMTSCLNRKQSITQTTAGQTRPAWMRQNRTCPGKPV